MAAATECITQGVWHVCDSFNCIIDWLYQWQTMLTGVGAVGAALLTVLYLKKQIAATAYEETLRRTRRFAAARATLPPLLSDTIQFANEAIALLKQYLDAREGPSERTSSLSEIPRPMLPDQAILGFATLIETTEDDEFAGVIAEMISEMQILNSRLHGLLSEKHMVSVGVLHSYVINAAKVYGFAGGIFEFARRKTETPPHALNWDDAFSGLRLNNIYGESYSELYAFMGRIRDRHQTASS